MDDTLRCPIRRTLARLPWVDDQRAGARHWLALQRDPLAWLAQVHAEQPDMAVSRMGLNRVWCLFHPEAVHQALVEHRALLRRWELSLCMMRQWNGRSFMMREGPPAQAQRKAVRPHIAAPQPLEILQLAERWGQGLEDGGEVDLDLQMAAYSATLTGHALFGMDLRDQAFDIARAVRLLSRVALLETSTGIPLGHWFPSKLCPRKRWALGRLQAVVAGIAEQSPRPLAAQRDELATLLMAGHQSTGVTLTWTLLMLARHPEVLAALRQELAGVDWSRIEGVADLRGCPLLRAVIQESLRLYPPAYGLVPRQLTADTEVFGQTLQKGDILMLSSWITHRDPRWFDEPLAFRPQRFLEPATWPKGAYFPFGLGDRACPGTAMAMLDVAVSLAWWVTHWDVEPLGAIEPQGWFSLRPRRARVRLHRR